MFAPFVIQEKVLAPESTKVIKLNGGRVSIVDVIQLSGWTSETRLVWQLDRSLIILLAQENGKLEFDASNQTLIPRSLRRRLDSDFMRVIAVFNNPQAGVVTGQIK